MGRSGSGGSHLVQFYEGDAFLADAVARFVGDGLEAGDAAVVIATPPHRGGVEERLRIRGLELMALGEQGRYVSLDARETLERIVANGSPDESRFTEVVGRVIAGAATKGATGRVRAFGEMVTLLCAEGKSQSAIRLEELWNGLVESRSFSLLCAYPVTGLRGVSDDAFLKICGEHSEVIPAESYTALTDPAARLRTIAQLQQRASASLEAEIAIRRQAEETHARLAAIVESSDDAIIGKTLDGIVVSWNRGAERLFGYTAQEMIGQPISRLMPPERPDDFTNILDTIRRGERVEHFETVRMRKDGSRVHVSLTVSPIRDRAGNVIGASKSARDVTERRRADAERERLLRAAERARAEAEAANRSKDEFLVMLAHELRNPLSAVRNAVVSARLDRARRERALEIARRQTDQLGRLVDDLLDVARITQRRIVLRKQPVYLADVVDRAVEATRALVEDRGHRLSVALPADAVRVNGDPARLEQIVVNLVGNAAKYTDAGGRIELLVEAEDGEAVLRVRDSGIGIAPDMLPRVFDLFVQGDRGLDRAQGGLGIGLTVVRQLVELHGGRIEARSDGIGKGSEFVVRLPATRVIDEATGAAAARTRPMRRRCARVVVVEDNPDAAESLMMLLEVLGHRVRVFHDGMSALEAARANVPDVMLVDIGLPGMDGYEIARRARGEPRLRHVILVALTGYGHEEDRRRALAAGFDYHLVKPVDVERLEGLVAQLASTPAVPEDPTIH